MINYSPEVMSQARELYARQVQSGGPKWKNTADNIRAGWSNMWVMTGILAIAPLVALAEFNAGEMET